MHNKNKYSKQISTWWEIGKQRKKKKINKQGELIQLIAAETTKNNSDQNKINKAHQHIQNIESYKIT